PKGLEGKRQPVTHDECGRPFAKDEDLEQKIKAKKQQYKDINTKMPDPLKVGMKISAKGLKKEEQRAENESGEKVASPECPEGKVDSVIKQDEPDSETKQFLEHWEPQTKHPKEPTAGMPAGQKAGQKTTPTG